MAGRGKVSLSGVTGVSSPATKNHSSLLRPRHKNSCVQEICLVLLDVGPRMQSCLDTASKTTSNFLLSKILSKPSHEAALFFYGTDGSQNDLYEEFKREGDDSQYCHITQIQPLAPPTVDFLASLKDLKPEQGKSDFIDALICGADAIYKALDARPQLENAQVKKRIILLSNFLQAAKEDEGWEFAQSLTGRLQQQDVFLDVVSIDMPDQDEQFKADKVQNQDALHHIFPHVRHRRQSVQSPLELLSAFPFKEYGTQAYYSGPLTVANEMSIAVKVAKKTSKENMPSFGKYSGLSIADDATHTVSYDRSFKAGEGDAEEEVAPEDVGKAYKYGSQIIPLPKEAELAMKYVSDKSFQVIGVVPQEAVPHSLFVKDVWVVAPEKGNAAAFHALTAISMNLKRDKTGMLARFLPRVNGDISIGFLTPLPSDEEGVKACLVMNIIPFEADMRAASFTAFSHNEALLPHKEQTAAVDQLIKAFTLTKGRHEQLAPEKTASPSLAHFASAISNLALDSDSPIAEDGSIQDQLLSIPHNEARQKALKAMAQHFSVRNKEGDGKPAAELIVKAEGRSQGPDAGSLEEFEQLLEARKFDEAFSTLFAGCKQAMAAQEHKAAVRLVTRLRGACTEFSRAKQFNDFLQAAQQQEDAQAGSEFWQSLRREQLGLVSMKECSGGATDQDSQAFLNNLPRD